MSEIVPAAGLKNRPNPVARLSLLSLPWLFLALWAGLLWLLGRTLSQLILLNLDPAALLLWLTLGPMTLHLAQAPFFRPKKPSGPPVFLRLRLFSSPLVFLPFSAKSRLETGPAFFEAAAPDEQARLLASAGSRLKNTPLAGRMSFMVADRSPLDLALRTFMNKGPWPLGVLARLLLLVTSPTRQLTRLWGYLSFLAWSAAADPGPAEDLIRKRREAWHLKRRARTLGQGEKIWLDPRYQGVFLDLPVTLHAPSTAELYAAGRPEKDLGLFYPPELAQEAEAAADLAAERDFLAHLLDGEAEEGLIWLDGRLRPTWSLAAELNDLEDRYDRALRRISTHHARCRAAHLALSASLGRDWPEALRGWGALLWLAEHGRQALARARDDYMKACFKEPAALGPAEDFYTLWSDLQRRLADLDQPSLPALPPPAESNLAEWRSAWPAAWAGLDQSLAELRDQALTGLLAAEARVAGGQGRPGPSIPPMIEPAYFPAPVDPPRPLRVYYPSNLFKAGPGRCGLAALILALLIWQGWNQGLSKVTIYNGLATVVTVKAGGRTVTLPPFGHRGLRLRPGIEYEFTAAAGGLALENFRRRLSPRPAREVYNVAGAAPLMEWWFPRRPDEDGLERFLGRPRWLVTEAAVIFDDPPEDRRNLVLSGYGDADPAEMLAAFSDPDERAELARLHARHTPPESPRFLAWLAQLPEDEGEALIRERLAAPPPLEAPDLLDMVEEYND